MTTTRFRPTLRLMLTGALQECEMQQRDIADRMGVSAQTITAWLRGHREPTLAQLKAYAEVTGCDWLLDLRILIDDDADARGVSGGVSGGSVSEGCFCITAGQRPFFANEAPSWN